MRIIHAMNGHKLEDDASEAYQEDLDDAEDKDGAISQRHGSWVHSSAVALDNIRCSEECAECRAD